MNSFKIYDLDDALHDPSKAFDHPRAVVTCDELSKGDKLKILKQWELDARSLQVAEEENMGGGEPDLLVHIHDALRELVGDLEQVPQSDTKLG